METLEWLFIFASILPGLEYVLSNKITDKVSDAEILQIHRGKVFFSTAGSFPCLSFLRLSENLFRVMDQFQMGQDIKHLSQLREQISCLDLDDIHRQDLFWINASRKGNKHSLSLHLSASFTAHDLRQKGHVLCVANLPSHIQPYIKFVFLGLKVCRPLPLDFTRRGHPCVS